MGMSVRHIVPQFIFKNGQKNASRTTNLSDILYYSLPLTESIWNVWPWSPAKSGLRPYAVVSARLVVSGTAHFCVGSTLPPPPADQNNGCSNISISDDYWQKQKYKYKLKVYQTNTPIQANKTNKEKNNKMSQKQDHHMQQSQKTWAQVYCTCPKSLNPSRILRTWKIPIFLILWWPS